MTPTAIVVPARTGLAGHPSDAFGGAVLATPVPELAATVTIAPAEGVAIGDRRFRDLDDLRWAEHRGPSRLLTAAAGRFATWLDRPVDGFALTWQTTIPRSVGLAGSSALVIGALRALAAHAGVALPDDVGPRLALEVEVDLLGIAAGPQDRIVQWHATTVLMDFAGDDWHVEPVHPPAPIPLLVAWTEAGARSSGATHAPLQERREEAEVRRRMDALAALAREAADAVRAGDVAALAACLDAGFEHRRALVPLDPAPVAMVEELQALGAGAAYTGSGGAVVAVAPDPAPLKAWADRRHLPAVETSLR